MIDRLPDQMPWWAYLAVNAVVWVLTATAWWATREGWILGPPATVPRPGAAVLLVFVPVAFALASIFDYVSARSESHRRATKGPAASRGGDPGEADRDA